MADPFLVEPLAPPAKPVATTPQRPRADRAKLGRLFESVDGWDEVLEPAAFTALNDSLLQVNDPAEAKKRVAVSSFLADASGVDVEEIDANPQPFMDAWAEQVLGPEHSGKDVSAFYADVGAFLKKQDAELSLIGEQQNQIFQAMAKGGSFTEAWNKVRAATIMDDRYDMAHTDVYEQQHRAMVGKVQAIMLDHPELVQTARSYFVGRAQPDSLEAKVTPALRERLIDELAFAPDDVQQAILMLGTYAGAGKRTDMGETSKVVSRVTRRAETDLRAAGRSLKTLLTPPGSVQELQAARRNSIARKLDQLESGVAVPMELKNAFFNSFANAAESLPQSIAMASGPGMAVSVLAAHDQMAGEFEQRGLSPENALGLAAIAAPVYAGLEKVESLVVLGHSPVLSTPARKTALGWVMDGVQRFASGFASEMATESAQDLVAPTMQFMERAFTDKIPQVDWAKEWQGLKETTPQTMATVAWFSVIGSGVGTMRDRAAANKLFKNREALLAYGYPEEVVDAIQRAKDPDEAAEILRQNHDKRKPGTAVQKGAAKALADQAATIPEGYGFQWNEDEFGYIVTDETGTQAGVTNTAAQAADLALRHRAERSDAERKAMEEPGEFVDPLAAQAEKKVTTEVKAEQIRTELKNPNIGFQYSVWPEAMLPPGADPVMQVDLIDTAKEAEAGGLVEGANRGSTNRRLLASLGVELPSVPRGTEPGKYRVVRDATGKWVVEGLTSAPAVPVAEGVSEPTGGPEATGEPSASQQGRSLPVPEGMDAQEAAALYQRVRGIDVAIESLRQENAATTNKNVRRKRAIAHDINALLEERLNIQAQLGNEEAQNALMRHEERKAVEQEQGPSRGQRVLEWLTQTKLPTIASLEAKGDPLAGDIEGMELPRSMFSKDKASDLDALAHSLLERLADEGDQEAAAMLENGEGVTPSWLVDQIRSAWFEAQAATTGGETVPFVEMATGAREALTTEVPVVEVKTESDSSQLALPPTTALNKKEIAALRKPLGLDELPEPERERWEDVLGSAKAKNLAATAENLADQILGGLGIPNAEQHAAMVLRAAELQNQYEQTIADATRLAELGNEQGAQNALVVAENILAALDKITEASDKAGTAAARALSIRRMRISRNTYDLLPMVQRATLSYGRKLTAEETARFKRLADDMEAAEEKIADLEAALAEKTAVSAKRTAQEVFDEARKKRIGTRKVNVEERRKEYKDELKKLGYRLNDVTNVVGLSYEAAVIVAKIADTYIEEGVASLSELVKKMQATIPDLSENDIYHAVGRRIPSARKAIETEAKRRKAELQKQARLQSKINDLVAGMVEKPLEVRKDSDEAKALRERLRDLRLAADKNARDDAQLRRIHEKINEAQGILDGTITKPAKVEAPAERADIQKAREELEALRKQIRDIEAAPARAAKEAAKPAEQVARLKERVAELEAMLEAGTRPTRKPVRPEMVDVVALRAQIRQLERLMRTQDAIADLQSQLETGDFTVAAAPEPVVISAELERALHERQRLRREVNDLIEAKRKRTNLEKVFEVAGFSRAAVLTADISAVARQGFIQFSRLALTKPTEAARIFSLGLRAAFSEYTADAIDQAIRNPLGSLGQNQYERERAKLFLSDLDGVPTKREEAFRSNFASRIPGFGAIVRGSSRNMTTVLNLLRVSAFDNFLDANPDSSLETRKLYADYINKATGRGNLGRLSADRWPSLVFMAPRWFVSRFQVLYSPLARFDSTGGRMSVKFQDPAVQKEIAKDFASVLTLGLTTLFLASLGGADVEDDPESPDWGKIRMGPMRIDIWGGLQQPMRLLMTPILAVGNRTDIAPTDKDIDPIDAARRFLSYKLSFGVTVPNQLFTGKDIVGNKVTLTETAAKSLIPMVITSTYDVWRDTHDASMTALAGTLNLLGVGVSSYKKKKRKKSS